jgi:hypothetical protein
MRHLLDPLPFFIPIPIQTMPPPLASPALPPPLVAPALPPLAATPSPPLTGDAPSPARQIGHRCSGIHHGRPAPLPGLAVHGHPRILNPAPRARGSCWLEEVRPGRDPRPATRRRRRRPRHYQQRLGSNPSDVLPGEAPFIPCWLLSECCAAGCCLARV